VTVGLPMSQVNETLRTLMLVEVIGLLLAMTLVAGLGRWLIRRELRPLEEVASTARQVTALPLEAEQSHVPYRVTVAAQSQEIGEVADAFNDMLDHVDNSLEARAANEAQLRQFVADASHELRTPLTAIRAQLEVDLAHPERADWEATAQGVLEDATSMQELVGDLLALADLDAVRAVAAPRAPVDLDDVVLAEVARHRLTARVAIDTHAVSGAQVLGDGGQLTRLVRNLLDNAVRHADTGVTVTLVELGGNAILTVANDGSVIPVEDRLRIFERFARLDDARAEHSGGTGLGLAIVREIAEHHDGRVEVVDGPTAAFRVSLPLAMGAD